MAAFLRSVGAEFAVAITGVCRAVKVSFQGPAPHSPSMASGDKLAAYDASLRNRGSLTVWFTQEALAGWRAQPRKTLGGQVVYSELAIETALTLRAVFRLALRQSEGLIGSVMRMLAIDLPIPDHTTLSWRACGLPVQSYRRTRVGDLHLIVDSTGRKLHGAGEWLVEKHGTAERRSWRKFHIGIDADNGEIVAFDLTDKEVDDASHVEALLEQLDEAPASFMADCAYDRSAVLDAVLARNPNARFSVPPCKGGIPGPAAKTAPTQRDLHGAILGTPFASVLREQTRAGANAHLAISVQQSSAQGPFPLTVIQRPMAG